VWDGHVGAVDGVPHLDGIFQRRVEVGDDLVAVEVEVDPVAILAPCAAAELAGIEDAAFFEIANGKGEVEWTGHFDGSGMRFQ